MFSTVSFLPSKKSVEFWRNVKRRRDAITLCVNSITLGACFGQGYGFFVRSRVNSDMGLPLLLNCSAQPNEPNYNADDQANHRGGTKRNRDGPLLAVQTEEQQHLRCNEKNTCLDVEMFQGHTHVETNAQYRSATRPARGRDCKPERDGRVRSAWLGGVKHNFMVDQSFGSRSKYFAIILAVVSSE
jgi:hypothetical protein